MEFNKKYEPYALQLYLYLAKNADGYSFALSQRAAEKEAGIKKTSFHKYVDLLIREGYLVRRGGNIYDFYEIPQKKEKEEVECPPCDGFLSSLSEQENLPHDHCSSSQLVKTPPHNKEIYNRYTNNEKIDKDSFQQQAKGDSTKNTERKFVF